MYLVDPGQILHPDAICTPLFIPDIWSASEQISMKSYWKSCLWVSEIQIQAYQKPYAKDLEILKCTGYLVPSLQKSAPKYKEIACQKTQKSGLKRTGYLVQCLQISGYGLAEIGTCICRYHGPWYQISWTARLNIVLATIRYLGLKLSRFLDVSFSYFRTKYLDAGRTSSILCRNRKSGKSHPRNLVQRTRSLVKMGSEPLQQLVFFYQISSKIQNK